MNKKNYFIVYAKNGSRNGWAIIEADTKKQARINAYDEWLDGAKIVDIITFEHYCKRNALTESEIKEILKKVKGKLWHELEWGS